MTLRLILEEDGKQTEFKLNQASATIGRTADNLIRVRSSMSSRQHCKVFRTEEGFFVQDLNSRNGTKVNGGEIKRHLLVLGDRIEIGDSHIHFGQVLPSKSPPAAEAKTRRVKSKKTARPKKPKSLQIALQVIQPSGAPIRKLDQFPFIIGKAEQCALTLDASELADNHCMIMKANDSFFVVDMNAPSGTLVNGKKVSREDLVVGSVLQLGQAILQVVDANPSSESSAKKPSSKKAVIDEPEEFDASDFEDDEDDAPVAAPSKKTRPAERPKASKADPKRSRRAAKASSSKSQSQARKPKAAAPPKLADLEDDGLGASLNKIDIAETEKATPAWLVTLQSIVALVILVLIFGLAISILIKFLGRPKFEKASEDNLIGNWSFEEPLAGDGSVPGWSLETAGSGASIDFVSLKSVSDSRRQVLNSKAMNMVVGDKQRATISSSDTFAVQPNQLIQAAAHFTSKGSGSCGIILKFLTSDERVISSPIVDFLSGTDDQQLSGTAAAPPKATSMELILFATGQGNFESRVDRVELKLDPGQFTPVGAERGKLKLSVGRRGVAELLRNNGNGFEQVISSISLSLVDKASVQEKSWQSSEFSSQNAAKVLSLPKERKRGLRFRGEIFDSAHSTWRKMVLDVEPVGSSLSARYRVDKPQKDPFYFELALTIAKLRSVGAVQIVDKDGRGDFVKNVFKNLKETNPKANAIAISQVLEIVFGNGAKKISLRLPKASPVLIRKSGSSDQLDIRCLVAGFAGEKDISAQFQFADSSTLEQAKIRSVFANAQQAMLDGEMQTAVALYTSIISEFFDEKAKRLATTRIEEIENQVKNELEVLKLASRDLEKIEQEVILADARSRVKKLEKAFPEGRETKAARKVLSKMTEKYAQQKMKAGLAESQALLDKANRYRTERHSALARAILEQIVKSYPADYRTVREASGILERMGAN